MKKFIIIHNLNSRGKNIKKNYIENLFLKHNLEFEIFQTKNVNELDEIIKKYADSEIYQYTSIGGDGSLNALVNSLMLNKVQDPLVSCLPGGSGSDFIRTFALPQNFNEAFKHLLSDSYYEVDVGMVQNENLCKYFINVLNIGYLASTVEISEKLPKFVRKYRYPLSFWLKIFPAKPQSTFINLDGYEFKNPAFNVCVCNAQYFGGGWNISPKSSLQDGLFNIQIFAVTKLAAMKIFFLAKKGLHLREEKVITKKSSSIKILSRNQIEIDGDFFGYGPADIFIKKRAIRFKI